MKGKRVMTNLKEELKEKEQYEMNFKFTTALGNANQKAVLNFLIDCSGNPYVKRDSKRQELMIMSVNFISENTCVKRLGVENALDALEKKGIVHLEKRIFKGKPITGIELLVSGIEELIDDYYSNYRVHSSDNTFVETDTVEINTLKSTYQPTESDTVEINTSPRCFQHDTTLKSTHHHVEINSMTTLKSTPSNNNSKNEDKNYNKNYVSQPNGSQGSPTASTPAGQDIKERVDLNPQTPKGGFVKEQGIEITEEVIQKTIELLKGLGEVPNCFPTERNRIMKEKEDRADKYIRSINGNIFDVKEVDDIYIDNSHIRDLKKYIKEKYSKKDEVKEEKKEAVLPAWLFNQNTQNQTAQMRYY